MAEDFIVRLSRANAKLVRYLAWSIDNKQLQCAANLHPIAQAIAAILTDMINKQHENFTRRERIKLVRKHRKWAEDSNLF